MVKTPGNVTMLTKGVLFDGRYFPRDLKPAKGAILGIVEDKQQSNRLFVIKQFIGNDATSLCEDAARLNKAANLCNANIYGHARVVTVNSSKRYVVLESVLEENNTWAPTLRELLEGGNRKLTFDEAWLILRHLAETIKGLAAIGDVGGHFNLDPENILVTNPDELQIAVIDSLDSLTDSCRPDLEWLGRLFFYALTGNYSVCEPDNGWTWYAEHGVETLRKAQKLTPLQQKFFEKLMQKSLGEERNRFHSADELIFYLKKAPDVLPIPPLYSYSILAVWIMASFPVLLLIGNILWQLRSLGQQQPLTPTIVMTPSFTPTPLPLTATVTETMPPVPTTVTPTYTPKVQLTLTYTPLPDLTLTPTAFQTHQPTRTPTPLTPGPVLSPTAVSDARIQAKPGFQPAIREHCGNGQVYGFLDEEYAPPRRASLNINDANPGTPGCVVVVQSKNVRGYVKINEICIMAEDYDRFFQQKGNNSWIALKDLGFDRCES